MPTSPPTACPCGGRKINGMCDRCGTKRTRRREHARKTTERGYGWDWQQFRQSFIAEHPLCEDCLEQGIVTAAEEIHHMQKIKHSPELRLDPSNCRGLCGPCHDKRTAKGE